MSFRMDGTVASVVAVMVCLAGVVTARPSTEVNIAGVSVRADGPVTAIVLLFGQEAKLHQNVTVLNLLEKQQVNNPQLKPKNCMEVKDLGHTDSGVYSIAPYCCRPEHHVDVYCDLTNDGGGWTVIQRRDKYETQLDFYRPWGDYVKGFGDLTQEFWLGLDIIHTLTKQTKNEVRFDLEDFNGDTKYAKYDSFSVADEERSFTLDIGEYSGNAGDAMEYHNHRNFTTKDQDNDTSGSNCANIRKGAWWYGSCLHSNLNGEYLEGTTGLMENGVTWYHWRGNGYSLKKTEIKIRPASTPDD